MQQRPVNAESSATHTLTSLLERFLAWRKKRAAIRNCPGHVMQAVYHSWYYKHCPYEEHD